MPDIMIALFILLGIFFLIIFLSIIEKIITRSVDKSNTNELVKKILENQELEKEKKE